MNMSKLMMKKQKMLLFKNCCIKEYIDCGMNSLGYILSNKIYFLIKKTLKTLIISKFLI